MTEPRDPGPADPRRASVPQARITWIAPDQHAPQTLRFRRRRPQNHEVPVRAEAAPRAAP